MNYYDKIKFEQQNRDFRFSILFTAIFVLGVLLIVLLDWLYFALFAMCFIIAILDIGHSFNKVDKLLNEWSDAIHGYAK